jgi:hypothetical protein
MEYTVTYLDGKTRDFDAEEAVRQAASGPSAHIVSVVPKIQPAADLTGIDLGMLAYDISDMIDRNEYPIDIAQSDIEPNLPPFLRACLATSQGTMNDADKVAALTAILARHDQEINEDDGGSRPFNEPGEVLEALSSLVDGDVERLIHVGWLPARS